MNTEEIIKKALDEQMEAYSQYHTFILLGFVIVQGVFIYWQNRNMEKFKAILKKSEIKYSRYHELQVEALRIGYQKLVLFGIANKSLLNSEYETNDHRGFKIRINNWIQCHHNCINQLAYDKIVLPKELKEAIHKTIDDFQVMTDILVGERKHLDYVEEDRLGDWNAMYSYSENELEIINQKITRLKSHDYIKKSTDNIKALRTSIEEVFERMNA
ncbi:MAG: hypothetical protein EOO90_23395 [Pedobacter sp.]|nr:MAG: hypothetical protein EOO90_23395 [Pedobacter sp.]